MDAAALRRGRPSGRIEEVSRPDPSAPLRPAGAELAWRHLQVELARIDVLLRREVARWQRAGQDPGDPFRGLYVSDEQADALLERPLGANGGFCGGGALADEMGEGGEALRLAQQQSRALAEAARCQGTSLPLIHLQAAFGLDAFELDALLIAVAPALDLRYERLYGYLQDDVTRRRAGVSLILDLLCGAGPERLAHLSRFHDGAPLLRRHLVERVSEAGQGDAPLLAQSLTPDATVVAWLAGRYTPGPALAGHVELLAAPEDAPAPDGPLAEALVQAAPRSPLVVLHGPDVDAQREAARWLAHHAKRTLLAADLAGAVSAGTSPSLAVRLALRDARLMGAIPLLHGWDACLDEGAAPHALLAELCAHPGPVVVAGAEAWRAQRRPAGREILSLAFPVPDYARRCALWQRCLADASIRQGSGATAPTEVTAVAGQFRLTTAQIGDAVAAAGDMAAQAGRVLAERDLLAAARAQSNPRLSSLALKIEPRYGWDDIVLPDDQVALLRELVATVRGRPQVLDGWGLGRKLVSSRGVTALFSGPPGTGKTMAAQVIAGELGLDLYRIDLSTVVSKYIGETEKNLAHVFQEAEQSNAILFFDEADALFGKRSEVRDSHDRYANIEISYLLQRMEAYDGVTILATNLRANLDEAFTRRLQFAVDLPFPEAEDRLRIWRTLFPPDAPRGADVDLPLLASRFRLAGGSIRNVLVSAAYLAADDGGAVTMAHLLHGVRRELQKMGRLVGEGDLDP